MDWLRTAPFAEEFARPPMDSLDRVEEKLTLLNKKLAHFERERIQTADPGRQFEMDQEIEEIKAQIREAEAERATLSAAAPDALALYRERLLESVRTVKIFGVREPFELEHVFVSLTVIDAAEVPPHADFFSLCDPESRIRRGMRLTGERRADAPPKIVAPDELLKPGVQALASGAPGGGKTTLLRWLARLTLRDETRLPVLVELKSVADFSRPLETILFASVLENAAASSRLTTRPATACATAFSSLCATGGFPYSWTAWMKSPPTPTFQSCATAWSVSPAIIAGRRAAPWSYRRGPTRCAVGSRR